MPLRTKVFVILTGMMVLISSIIFFYSRAQLLNEYSKLEIKEVGDDLIRTNKTFASMFSSLKVLSYDWSQRDDAYKFMHDKNPAFIKSNMAFTTFENAKLNLILFYDTKGKLFYGENYDLTQKKFTPIPISLLKTLDEETTFTLQTSDTGNKTGILKVENGYVVLCSAPILTSQGKGPIAGTLIMGYFFSANHLATLADIVNMQINLYTLPIPKDNTLLNQVYSHLSTGQTHVVIPINNESIRGYTLIRDIDKNPIGILSIQSTRALFQEGVKIINRYLVIVVAMGVLFLFSLLYLLKTYVLDRIISVSKQVIQIKTDCDFSKRIYISGSDEITGMVSALNSLMELIELSQDQLKYHLRRNTEELGNIASLNKNLSAEISKQKEIEYSLREGEKILRHMAYYDILTELPNRYFFNEMLQKNLSKAEREGTGVAVLFADADKFKEINDTYGHDIGDKFLVHVANQIKNSIKGTDIAARLAGDEFIICLYQIHSKELIANVAHKILTGICTPLMIDGVEIKSSFSMGIAVYPEDGTTLEELEKNADLAMYYAKKQHGTAFCFYDEITSPALTI